MDEWNKLVTKICPFTRKPCVEQIDPAGDWSPGNVRQCNFLGEDAYSDECRITRFLDNINDGPLGEMLGVFLHHQTFGRLPGRHQWVDKQGKTHFGEWDWQIW